MLTKKVPIYTVYLTLLFSVLFSFLGFSLLKTNNAESDESLSTDINVTQPFHNSCGLNVCRLKGYQFIHPLLYAEPLCESEELSGFKNQISQIIAANKSQGKINTASVYLRIFNQAQWTAVNSNESYSPGSLLKVPELIALYKMNEMRPGFLDKEVLYNNTSATKSNRIITFNSNHITLGKKYTVRELIRYMIVYSDNDATMLLNSLVDKVVFSKVFSDIGLKEPDFSSSDYKMNVSSYSIFLKELYNGSYLNFKDSEECLNLLSQTEFKDGMISGLPANMMASHKFGEGGPNTEPNFSEAAIVYCGNTPYILTIMTKGNDMKQLPAVTAEISKKVYQLMSARS